MTMRQRIGPKKTLGVSLESVQASSYLTTFTSLTLIMLSFFVFLNCSVTPDAVREQAVIRSIREEFALSSPIRIFTGHQNANRAKALESLRAAIQKQFPQLSTELPAPGQLKLETSASTVFTAQGYQIRAPFVALFEQLAASAHANNFRLDALIAVPALGVEASDLWMANFQAGMNEAATVERIFRDLELPGASSANTKFIQAQTADRRIEIRISIAQEPGER